MTDMSVTNLQYPQDWIERKKQKELISVVTCYDFLVAKWISKTDIDAILVGDSLGMVVQGNNSTLPVKLEDIIYHTKIVRRGAPNKFLIADMPYGSYQSDLSEGLRNSFRVIKETNCQALKFEGADDSTLKVIDSLVKSGFPVMGHIGLTPQSFMMMRGFRIQGKEEKQKQILLEQAKKIRRCRMFCNCSRTRRKRISKRNLFKTYYTYHRYWFGKSNRWPSTCDLRFIRNGPRFYPKTCKKIH